MPYTKKKTEVAVQPKASLIAKMAAERSVDPTEFYHTVTETMFKGANKAQLMTLLLVADRYHLDVTTKEIYAFPGQGGGIVPVVSIDGWISLAHQHPQYDGEEFRYADKMVVPAGGKACPEWMEIVVYRKDTSHPTVIREYLEECFRSTATWKSHTKRMLRHKTMIQGYRVAFGFSGIKDDDEGERITLQGTATPTAATDGSSAARARAALGAAPTPTEASSAPESPPVEESLPNRLSDEAYDPPVDVDEVTGEVIPPDEYEPPVDDAPEDYEVIDVGPKATKQQVAAINAAKRNNQWGDEEFAVLLAEYDVAKPSELTREQALEVVRQLMAGPGEQEEMGL